jgi:hypothetical protein
MRTISPAAPGPSDEPATFASLRLMIRPVPASCSMVPPAVLVPVFLPRPGRRTRGRIAASVVFHFVADLKCEQMRSQDAREWDAGEELVSALQDFAASCRP